jgi:hypothetical protein
MSEIEMRMAAPEGVALTVLTHLQNGKIDDAIARFVEKLTFKDHGIGWSSKTQRACLRFSGKHGNSTQTPSWRRTRSSSVGIT